MKGKHAMGNLDNKKLKNINAMSEEELKDVSGGTICIEEIPSPGDIDALNEPIDLGFDPNGDSAKTREKKGPLSTIMR